VRALCAAHGAAEARADKDTEEAESKYESGGGEVGQQRRELEPRAGKRKEGDVDGLGGVVQHAVKDLRVRGAA